MAPKRPNDRPSLVFVHRGHEFHISVMPAGAGAIIHIADQYGRFMLPYSSMIASTHVRRGRCLDRPAIDTRMAELRRAIEELDDAGFLRFLETPRTAGEFEWTAAELDAASRIDWSKPAATIVHEGHSFAIGAFMTNERMVLLLRDADGPFDAPLSMPRASIIRAETKGSEPLAFGINAMIQQIRSWSASRTAAFVRDTSRLAPKIRANRQVRDRESES